MQNRLIFNLFKKDNYTGEEIAKDINLQKQLQEKENILNTPKVYKPIGENCVCTSMRYDFQVQAKGFLFGNFTSQHENLQFGFDEVNTMDLTIQVKWEEITCEKDKEKMLRLREEFHRAINHLGDDFGRFNLSLRDRCQILSNFEDHLKRNGFAIKNENNLEMTFRPTGNTAF